MRQATELSGGACGKPDWAKDDKSYLHPVRNGFASPSGYAHESSRENFFARLEFTGALRSKLIFPRE